MLTTLFILENPSNLVSFLAAVQTGHPQRILNNALSHKRFLLFGRRWTKGVYNLAVVGIMMTIILLLGALICFALFFKSIDFFDKI